MKTISIKSHKTLLFTIIAIGFPFLQSCAQPPETPLTHAQTMVQNKQYLSAFEYLDSLDPNNQNPDIFLAKQDIAIHYYIATVMHQMFAFENLQKNQDIEKMRKQQGNFLMKDFPVQEIFDTLIQRNPMRYDLYNGAAEFYYEILKTYPEGWILNKNEVEKRIEKYAPVAIKNKVGSAKTYYLMAYLYAQKEDYNQAMTYYAITLDKDPQFAGAYYNLALTQMYRKEFLAALSAVQSAIDLYNDSVPKAESFRLAGYICEELSDDTQAYKYFLEAWNHDKKNLDNIHALTDISLRLKKSEYKKYTNIYFETAPENAAVYGGLIEIYAQYNNAKELITFFEEQMPKYTNNSEVLANLYYFSAGLINKTDKAKASDYLKNAEVQFKKFVPKDNEIFIIIEEKLEELKR
ncbi:MAG: hypothetical protein J5I91_02100 [Bacteroidetes bacterium]|nr:hypothetical protein [Bacteroidota bacterium]